MSRTTMFQLQRQAGRLNWFRRRPCVQPIPAEYRPHVSQWLLRLLSSVTIVAEPAEAAHLLEVVGLAQLKIKDLGSQNAIQAFQARLADLEHQSGPKSGSLYRNIQHLAQLVGLSDLDQEMLALIACIHKYPLLAACLELFGDQSADSACELLGLALGRDRSELVQALRESSTLCSTGLLQVDHTETEIDGMLDLLAGLENTLFEASAEPAHLMSRYFQPAPPPRHPLAAFPHLREDIALLRRHLTAALQQNMAGINFLFHGNPGVGKTEFVKALASSLNVPLYAVSHETDNTNLDDPHFRFRSYRFSQKVLARSPGNLILFDEVEDVFPDSVMPFFGRAKNSGRYKAWTNAVLESNPRPAFWLCNSIEQIDPAFRCRFTYSIKFSTPPRSIRRSLLKTQFLHTPVRSAWIEQVADNRHLTPALIEQAGKLAALAKDENAATVEALAERSMQHALEVLGLPPDYLVTGQTPPLRYNLECLNANYNLMTMAQSLKARPKARLCFSGPPGCGKTAFAQHLAEQIDKPLIQKTASDLLNCYLGETEKNLAAMFRKAEDEDAVLLLDEADSFLQDRTSAHRSWEVTQVNELLKQMELFDSLFICATNLMDRLDVAVLRRFDIKVQFDYLRTNQAEKLFARAHAGFLGYNRPGRLAESVKTRLAKLTTLVPGDFATVVHQAQALGTPYNAEQLLTALEHECLTKQRGVKPIQGFVG